MFVHDKVMFEIYREAGYDRRYRVVFFTELDEHNKETEISRALDGDHYYDGYLKSGTMPEAKRAIVGLLERLNGGEAVPADEIDRVLADYRA